MQLWQDQDRTWGRNIRHEDIRLHWDDDHNSLLGTTIHFRQPKEADVKSCMIGAAQDSELCSVLALNVFLERTRYLRQDLPVGHKLSLAYIEDNTKVDSARPATVANWVKEIMNQAGIDVQKYPPHSIRSAASTKAVEKRVSL